MVLCDEMIYHNKKKIHENKNGMKSDRTISICRVFHFYDKHLFAAFYLNKTKKIKLSFSSKNKRKFDEKCGQNGKQF